MLNTPEYNLAKFLDDIIKPNIPKSFMVDSSINFLDELKLTQLTPSDHMVSFDVKSLFTNVPLDFTIGIIAEHIYSDKSLSVPSFPKNTFIQLLKLATGGLFMYKDIFIQQKDGVSMGNPLGPTMANFFMAYLEKTILNENHNFLPKFYRRYIDDIFCIFTDKNDVPRFLQRLNNFHENVIFTVEHGSTSLPFLDIEVKINDTGTSFDSCVYRKKSNTGVLLNYNALATIAWKRGIIFCFLNRAAKLCSNLTLFEKEVNRLKTLFYKNGYPTFFFNSVLQSFNYRNCNISINNVSYRNDSKSDFNKPFLKIPYFGTVSTKFSRNMSNLLKKHYNVDLRSVYYTFKVSNYFSLKSRTPENLVSNIVYKFYCLSDSSVFYICKTSKHFETRIKQHLNLKQKQGKSAICDHIVNCGACSNYLMIKDKFSIVKKCKSDYEAKIHEAFIIKQLNRVRNKQM